MTPKNFLPPPAWRRLLYRVKIFLGYLTGKGYWYWDVDKDELYWNKRQCRIFGLNQDGMVGQYKDFAEKLFSSDDGEYVRRSIEISRECKCAFAHQFFIENTQKGEKQLISAEGHWLFDKNGEPYALTGWNWRVKLPEKLMVAKENIIYIKKKVSQWENKKDAVGLYQLLISSK